MWYLGMEIFSTSVVVSSLKLGFDITCPANIECVLHNGVNKRTMLVAGEV